MATINFVNGVSGEETLAVGTHKYVSNTIPGYTNATMEDFTVPAESTQPIALKIAASGTLTVNLTDADGNPMQGGSFRLSNADGTEFYGEAVAVNNGVAVFEHVPYDPEDGITIYVAQTAVTPGYAPIAAPAEVTMDSAAETLNLTNSALTTATFTLEDQYYPGMVPLTGTVTVTRT